MHIPGMFHSRLRGLSILTGAALTLAAAPASADVELAPLVVIDLSTFDGSGFDPEPAAGQLDSDDWAVRLGGANAVDFGETQGVGSVFAWGTSMGDVDDGGIWAFDVDGAGLIALGVQPTDNLFTPGQIALRLHNGTGADVTEFQVEYTVWVNNNNPRSNSLNFAESPDDAAYTPVGDPFLSPEAQDKDGFVPTEVTQVVMPAAAIGDEGVYYIAWEGDDELGAGMERDEFGIEAITIRLLNVCGNGLVEEDEVCDDGLANSDTGMCLTTCAAAACGDGFVQDGVEECDDANVADGDGCAADCTVEVAGSTGTDGGTAADETGATTSASDSDSDSDSASASATATMTDATATNPTSPGDESGSDGDSGDGGADGGASCSCRSSERAAPIWGMVGLMVLGLVRRRR